MHDGFGGKNYNRARCRLEPRMAEGTDADDEAMDFESDALVK